MFGMGKPKEEDSKKSFEMIHGAMTHHGYNIDDFIVAYGHHTKKGLIKKTILSYAVGLANDRSKLVVISIDINGNVGEVIEFPTSQIDKANVNLQGAIVLSGGGNEVKLTVPPYTSSMAENMYQLPIVQEEQAKAIVDFVKSI